MHKKHIALIYEELDLGGRQMALLHLAGALHKRGWHVEIVSFLPGCLENKFRALGVAVHILKCRSKFQRIPALIRHFKHTRPMVVHTHLFSAGFWGRIAAKIAGVPAIIHTEGGMPFEGKRWKRVPAEQVLTRLSDQVICVAQAIKDHLISAGGLPASALQVIPNGVSAEGLLSLPLKAISDTPVLFSAGRLAPVKGYDVLLRAFAQLKQFNGTLRIAGDGPEADRLKALAKDLGINKKVEFLGYRTDVKELLAQSDLYVTPSRSEGMSNSILEAMAAGIAVVATDVGGNREVLQDVGHIVPPENPAALADGIRLALDDHVNTFAIINAARQRILSIYTLDKVVQAHETLYQQCLAEKNILLDPYQDTESCRYAP